MPFHIVAASYNHLLYGYICHGIHETVKDKDENDPDVWASDYESGSDAGDSDNEDGDKLEKIILKSDSRRAKLKEETTGKLDIKLRFIHMAQSSHIRAISSASGILLTGSEDETINVYNLETAKEVGTLMGKHSGGVGQIVFFPHDTGKGWAVSSCSGGKIVFWRVKDWEALLTIKAHPESDTPRSCVCMAVHPSSKLLLSIGSDWTLKIWNTATGKSVFSKKLMVPGRIKDALGNKMFPIGLQWSPKATTYTLAYGNFLKVFSAEGVELCEIKVITNVSLPSDDQVEEAFGYQPPLNSFVYLTESTLAVAVETGEIIIYSFSADSSSSSSPVADGEDEEAPAPLGTSKEERRWKAHRMRSKAISTVPRASITDVETQPKREEPYLITTSSDGRVKVWDAIDLLDSSIASEALLPAVSVHTGSRMICITSSPTRSFYNRAVKKEKVNKKKETPEEKQIRKQKKKELKEKKRLRKQQKLAALAASSSSSSSSSSAVPVIKEEIVEDVAPGTPPADSIHADDHKHFDTPPADQPKKQTKKAAFQTPAADQPKIQIKRAAFQTPAADQPKIQTKRATLETPIADRPKAQAKKTSAPALAPAVVKRTTVSAPGPAQPKAKAPPAKRQKK